MLSVQKYNTNSSSSLSTLFLGSWQSPFAIAFPHLSLFLILFHTSSVLSCEVPSYLPHFFLFLAFIAYIIQVIWFSTNHLNQSFTSDLIFYHNVLLEDHHVHIQVVAPFQPCTILSFLLFPLDFASSTSVFSSFFLLYFSL